MNDRDHMKQLIQLIESANLVEAPIDDYSKNPATPRDTSGDYKFDPEGEPNIRTTVGGLAGGLAGGSVPFFMNIDFLSSLVGMFGGGFTGVFVGTLLGIMSELNNNEWKKSQLQPYYKIRKQTAKQIANAPISTKIRSDLRSFMNNMLNNIPAGISKYAIEIKNISGYDIEELDDFYNADSPELTRITQLVAELLKDYLIKQNTIFNQVAKKHNITPLQLGAMASILYGDIIEKAFVKRLHSNLTK
jgi:hypothetical protein